MKPNFSGMATRYGVLCTDGRTIQADAFKHQDKARLPLLWRHDDKTPENVLGFVDLEHMDGHGVKAKAYFNKTARAEHSREMVQHGDITSLSIKAVRLKQQGTHVMHGTLTEVSLVPHGANSEARIEDVYLTHEDGTVEELEHEAIFFSGEEIILEHADDEDDIDEDEESDDSEPTIEEVYNTMTDDQKAVVEVLVNEAAKSASHEDSDESDDEQLNHEGENMPNRNVFDQTKSGKNEVATLSHEDQKALLQNAAKHGSLKYYVRDELENSFEHAGMEAPYGITNIEDLFPEFKDVQNRPEWIKRDTEWVAGVLSGVHAIPFTRLKSRSADITHEDARAKGYIKGNLKKRQYFAISSRTTDAKTIYKAQGFDRDDMIDIDFDVVAWVKEEMKGQLREELARAILFGDNRPEEDPANPGNPNPDKIDENSIRPIAFDEDFYTGKVMVDSGQSAKDLMRTILRSRKLLKGGTGRPTLYTEDDLVIDMLLLEDKLGRRYYESEAALATALGVANIVVCEVLEDGYFDEDGNRLIGVLVNLSDYDLGANRGGQETMFEDFDIDFNQNKYLIETRRAGALVKHRSAVALFETSAEEVFPVAPAFDGTDVTLPSITGVEYWVHTGTNDTVLETGTVTVPEDGMLYVEALPASGYRFPFNVNNTWAFER